MPLPHHVLITDRVGVDPNVPGVCIATRGIALKPSFSILQSLQRHRSKK